MANRALTEQDLELIKILITNPEAITKSPDLANKLSDIYTKPIKVADFAYLVGATQTIETNRLLRYIGVYQNIFVDKLGLTEKDFQKYFKEYDKEYDSRMKELQEKLDKEEAQANEIKQARSDTKKAPKTVKTAKKVAKKPAKKAEPKTSKAVPIKSKTRKGTK